MRRALSPPAPPSASAPPADAAPSSAAKRSRLAPDDPLAPPADATLCVPREILRLVFDFIPQRARILALSRVCKRWHAAVISTITDVSVSYHWTCDTFVASFTHLTALRSFSFESHARCPEAVELPVTLSSLTLAPRECVCESLPVLTGLTELALRDVHTAQSPEEHQEILDALIANNANTLVRLAPSVTSSLPDAHCPALRELTLNMLYHLTTPDRRAYETFIGHHASQLTAITILEGSLQSLVTSCGDGPGLCAPLFPQLRKLRQEAPAPFDSADLEIVRTHMPRLSELYLDDGAWLADEEEVLPAVSAMLRNNFGCLDLDASLSPLFCKHFAQNTSVRELCLSRGIGRLDGVRLGAHLTALDLVKPAAADLSALRHLTNLRSLSLRQLQSGVVDFASLPRSLRCIGIGTSVAFHGEMNDLLAQLAQHCAASGVAEVELLSSVKPAALTRFLERIERDGSVHRVSLIDYEACRALWSQSAWLELRPFCRRFPDEDRLRERRLYAPPFSWL